MGFDVATYTQDSMQDVFSFTTEQAIPLADCSYRYQWAKYGHIVIPPQLNLSGQAKGQLHGAHRTSLREFLHINITGNLTSTLPRSLLRRIEEDYSSMFDELLERDEQSKQFEKIVKVKKHKETIYSRISATSTVATILPLSIFLNFFHQRFAKHMYLESTMELLQQVHIQMVGYNPLYCFYPGDLHKYTL
jgi:hypothetical protein